MQKVILILQILFFNNSLLFALDTSNDKSYTELTKESEEVLPESSNELNNREPDNLKKVKKSKTKSRPKVTQPLFRNSKSHPNFNSNSPSQGDGKSNLNSTSGTKLSSAHDQFQRDRGNMGFTNYMELGYSGSAYRYSGEEYPIRRLDFVWTTAFENTCFTIYCIYVTRVTGIFDINNKNKNEFRSLLLGLRFPGELWGDILAPEYGVRGFLPATPDEINKDGHAFGYGGYFTLTTTPQLLGTDFYKISVGVNFRKDEYKVPVEKQKEWSSRQALVLDFLWTETLFTTFVFGYNYTSFFDQSEREIKEYTQTIRWRPNGWLDLMINHSNFGEFNSFDSSSGGADLVSIGTSTVGFSIGITSIF